ncbi:phage tail protein [Thauera sp.]|uniref:phage tail protein n=1 Tax=Thauera sp. TaxID=1905334 RepID=UPI002B870C4E|nr:phage tail protein [Thauera sp.]HRP24357.1 phage tail protein [Thauera sp.]
MDANRQRFWLLADDHHWPARSHVDYRSACRALHLSSERSLGAMVADAAAIAASALERLPHAIDREGATAWWDEAASALQVRSHLPAPATLLELPERLQDFAPGHDDVLYVALAGRLLLHDLRGRWPDFVLPTPGFQAWRVAAAAGGGAWLLERGSGRLARLRGCLQAARPAADYAATTFRPDPENADAPRLHLAPALAWPTGERPQAIAAHPDGRLALLSWFGDGECRLRLLEADARALGAAQTLAGLRFAYALDWLGDGGIAVRVPGRRDAPVFRPRATGEALTLQASGDIYPLQPEAEEAPFAHRLDQPPHYPVIGPALEPLHRLSVSRLARRGEAANFGAGPPHLIDSGDAATVWHRLYAEARLPAECGFVVWLAATAEPSPEGVVDWEPHVFGAVPAEELPAGPLPRAAWERLPSELPGHPGLGAWGAPQPGRAGLWTVLVQRHGRRVRALRGRYLWVRITLHGNGRDSPEIAALRAYGPRFPVRDQYLPRLYHETEFGAAADARVAPGEPQSTPADFLERFLGNVEGWLTALEDRVAAAHLLTDPDTVAEPGLDWLGSWIGVAFDPALPAARRRDWLRHAAELARFHGTRHGLLLALDLATDGGVRAGRIVVIEGFRIRRLLATLLGVDLNVEDDPLLPGLVISGNSVVGDTLILGEAERVELLALFRDEVASAAERAAVRAFYERLAYRTLVLLHGEQEGDSTAAEHADGLLRRIIELEAPAHVEVQIARASWPLLTGIASLVGVDTWLGPPRPPQPARADHSTLGHGDRVLGVASLDPRLSGAAATLAPLPLPVADAGADARVAHGRSFVLDGGGSHAAPGRHLTEYRWRLLG